MAIGLSSVPRARLPSWTPQRLVSLESYLSRNLHGDPSFTVRAEHYPRAEHTAISNNVFISHINVDKENLLGNLPSPREGTIEERIRRQGPKLKGFSAVPILSTTSTPMADAESAVVAQGLWATSDSSLGPLLLLNYEHLVYLVILFWDHLITLDNEINLIWRRKKSLSSYSFLVNRYFAFLTGIPVLLLPFLTLSSETCVHYTLFREVALLGTQLIVSSILVMRIYALFGRNRRVLWCILVIGAIVLGASVWSVTGQKGYRSMAAAGCHFAIMESTANRMAGCWEALFAFDSIIFGLTLYNAYTTRRRMAPRSNLHSLVLRDGAMYFSIMALANLANIATYYVPQPLYQGSLATFSNCISVTMVSRLILNLHAHANVGIFSELTGPVVHHNLPLWSVEDLIMTEAPGSGSQYSVQSRNIPPGTEDDVIATQATAGSHYSVYSENTHPRHFDGIVMTQATSVSQYSVGSLNIHPRPGDV
ncbi:hypothetical protein DFH09DRAFT_1272231 [Mycena vulgaris]|nr:hypothetical protein DFH09DRAFT_1272231 [Mycena vulgaris]